MVDFRWQRLQPLRLARPRSGRDLDRWVVLCHSGIVLLVAARRDELEEDVGEHVLLQPRVGGLHRWRSDD